MNVAELVQLPVLLSGERKLSMRFAVSFSSAIAAEGDEPAVRLEGYRYEVEGGDGSEILAYHWHPIGLSPVVEPHLHVTNRHPFFDLSKAHLPTGAVSPRAFLRCLITEFGVDPLRSDWQDILIDAERRTR